MHRTPSHRWLILSVAAFANSQLTAQTTSWTSFEDRAGYAIASDPQGGVLMFGGIDPSNQAAGRGDTLRLTAAGWTRESPLNSPSARSGHAMAAASQFGQTVYIMVSGLTQQQQVADTWVYQGGNWGPRGTGVIPTARVGHSMVTDFLRNQVYLFGGLGGILPRNDLYRFDPNTNLWSLRLPNQASPTVPAQRRNHCMAYDPGIDRVILFGGQGFGGSLSDTWSYDPTGNSWTNVNPTAPPPARERSAMTYLLGYGVVMFGGRNLALPVGQQVLGDTWVFQGGNWTQRINLPTSPTPRFGHAMLPDQSATSVVLVGGSDGSGAPIADTWLWNGSQWNEQLPAPSRREGAAMAYDETRDKHVVFGGRTVPGGTPLDETWEIDGLNWRERTPSAKPSPRSDAGVVFDVARNKAVLYGGRLANGQELGDTWEWNGSTWTIRVSSNLPPAAGGSQLVYDSLRNRTLGIMPGGSGTMEMWKLDGTGWANVDPARPDARSNCGSAWDVDRAKLVILGGLRDPAPPALDGWEWDGSWHRMNGAVPPMPRFDLPMFYDSLMHLAVAPGGMAATQPRNDCWAWNGLSWNQTGSIGQARAAASAAFDLARGRGTMFAGIIYGVGDTNDTLTWANGTWTQVFPGASPPPRRYASMAFDATRQRVVLFGGFVGSTTELGDTWEFDGTTWTNPSSAHSPSARHVSAMAYDPVGQGVLLFGGGTNSPMQTFGDTWRWNGVDWALLPTVSPPSARASHSLVSAGNKVLLWGGSDSQRLFSDLWQWNGQSWELLDSPPPTVRTNFGATYDVQRDRTVLFGGMSTNNRASATYNNETWEWDGDSWLRRFPTNSPSARGWCKLTYDAARSRTVMVGGADATNTFQDTWEWNGDNWVQQSTNGLPPGSFGHDITFDTSRNVAIAFGSFGTWEYGPIYPASTASFPAIWPSPTTCTGSLGPIRIQTLPWSGPWLGDRFEVDFENRPANSLGLFLWGFSNTTWNGLPLPVPLSLLNVPSPCNLLVDPFVTELVLAPRYESFQLPSDPILLSVPMFVQAGFFDNSPQGTQIVTTNGLELTFGRK